MLQHCFNVHVLRVNQRSFNEDADEVEVIANVDWNGKKYLEVPLMRLTCTIDRTHRDGNNVVGKVDVVAWFTPFFKDMQGSSFFENLRDELQTFAAANCQLVGTAGLEGIRLWWKGEYRSN